MFLFIVGINTLIAFSSIDYVKERSGSSKNNFICSIGLKSGEVLDVNVGKPANIDCPDYLRQNSMEFKPMVVFDGNNVTFGGQKIKYTGVTYDNDPRN